MTEAEAVEIAISFWLGRKTTPIVKVKPHFRADKGEWTIILDINPHDEDDFVVIIVNPETRKARIFGML